MLPGLNLFFVFLNGWLNLNPGTLKPPAAVPYLRCLFNGPCIRPPSFRVVFDIMPMPTHHSTQLHNHPGKIFDKVKPFRFCNL